jgi:hypothetical protein
LKPRAVGEHTMTKPFKNLEAAVKLYRQGVPIAEIARRQDPPVSRQAMWRALERLGVLKGGKHEK